MSFARPETIFGVIEPLMRDIFTRDRPRDHDAVSADAVRRGDGEVRIGQAGPACGMPIQDLSASCSASRSSACSRRSSPTAARSAASSCRTRAATRAAQVDGIVNQEKAAWARRPVVGAARGGRHRSRSSFPKAVGEDDGAPAARRHLARGNGQLAVRRWRVSPTRRRRLLGQLRLTLAKKDGLLEPRDVRVHPGSWTFRCWSGTRRRSATSRCTIRSRRRTTTTSASSTAIPAHVRAKAYDLVLNGSEIGGGSIRIHDAGAAEPDLLAAQHQRRGGEAALRLLPRGARVRDAAARRHRARPRPHRGAFSANESSIREVIAFPKTAAAVDLMSDAPSPVIQKQLRELHLQIRASRQTIGRTLHEERSRCPKKASRRSTARTTRNLKHIESLLERRDPHAGRRAHRRGRHERRAARASGSSSSCRR